MASTYTPIATTTFASTATSYTFSSIPTTYTDLVLVAVPAQGAPVGSSPLVQVGNGSILEQTTHILELQEMAQQRHQFEIQT